jgi:phosphonate transport system permease protein
LSDVTADMAAQGGVAPGAVPGAIPAAPTKSLSSTLGRHHAVGRTGDHPDRQLRQGRHANIGRLFSGSSNISTYGADLLRPDWGAIFPAGDFWTSFTHVFTQPTTSLAGQMWLTVQIALWGTFLAVFLGSRSA